MTHLQLIHFFIKYLLDWEHTIKRLMKHFLGELFVVKLHLMFLNFYSRWSFSRWRSFLYLLSHHGFHFSH